MLSVLCFSETWLDYLSITRYFLYELRSNHQIRSDCQGGADSLYIYKTFDFKPSPDLSVNNKGIEAITMEIMSSKKHLNQYAILKTMW